MNKICTKCKQEKNCSDFSEDKRKKSRLQAQCKSCCAERTRKWYSVNKKSKIKGPEKWTNEEEKIVLKNNPWYNIELIKFLPNRSWTSIKLKAKQLGLSFDHQSEAIHLERLIEENNEAYYWNGFLLADGSFGQNNRMSFCLAKKDREQIEKFAEFIGFKSVKEEKLCFSVRIQNKRICQNIVSKFNYKINKTLYPPIEWDISKIPTDLLLSHLIGFIDGDGGISLQLGRKAIRYRITIQIHSSWLNWINKYIEEISKRINIRLGAAYINNSGYCQITIAKIDAVYFLIDFIINNKLPVLNRKWDKVKTIYRKEIRNVNLSYV